MIEHDVHYCDFCGSRTPFGYQCPSCLKSIEKGQQKCSGCGRELYVACPQCKQLTFTGEKCEKCGANLMIKCMNKRCGELQFFDIVKCTSCEKKLSKK